MSKTHNNTETNERVTYKSNVSFRPITDIENYKIPAKLEGYNFDKFQPYGFDQSNTKIIFNTTRDLPALIQDSTVKNIIIESSSINNMSIAKISLKYAHEAKNIFIIEPKSSYSSKQNLEIFRLEASKIKSQDFIDSLDKILKTYPKYLLFKTNDNAEEVKVEDHFAYSTNQNTEEPVYLNVLIMHKAHARNLMYSMEANSIKIEGLGTLINEDYDVTIENTPTYHDIINYMGDTNDHSSWGSYIYNTINSIFYG